MLIERASLRWFSLALMGSVVDLSAEVTVQFYLGSDNLPAIVNGDTFKNRSDLDPGYAAIFNDSHTEYSGLSDVEFARYLPSGDENCIYWFRGNDTPLRYDESYPSVHWLGYGNSTFVDGAISGSDNYVHLVSSEVAVGILQFGFDELTGRATLIAAAWDSDGITFADGVAAIQAVPEPSTYAGILAAATLLYVVGRRRKNSNKVDS